MTSKFRSIEIMVETRGEKSRDKEGLGRRG